MRRNATIVGKGPAGLLSASLLVNQGWGCTVIADSDATMSLWSGSFDFYRPDKQMDSNPWSHIESLAIPLTAQQWGSAWLELVKVLIDAGIEISSEVPISNSLSITCTGRLKPVFVVPKWQYATQELESVWFVAIDGLADSLTLGYAEDFSRTTGIECRHSQLAAPPGWAPLWSPVKFAAFLDTSRGIDWLIRELGRASLGIQSDYPLLLPQVTGLRKPSDNLKAISQALSRPIYEYPLVAPSIGGMRVRDRWQWHLKQKGVKFLNGRVKSLTSNGSVTLDDGRTQKSDILVLATGGILGGGIEAGVQGDISDAISHEPLGSIHSNTSVVELMTFGHTGPRIDQNIFVVGRQRSQWDPDISGSGGALVVASVHEVVTLIRESIMQSETLKGGDQ